MLTQKDSRLHFRMEPELRAELQYQATRLGLTPGCLARALLAQSLFSNAVSTLPKPAIFVAGAH